MPCTERCLDQVPWPLDARCRGELGMDYSSPTRAVPEAPLQLTMVGGFRLHLGHTETTLPPGAQRLLAFLALHDVPLMRSYVAETLWPDSRRRRAAANL